MSIDLQFILKLALANGIIIFCSQIGKKLPSLGGLIATMPLTGLIIMIWLYTDDPGNVSAMKAYTKGALWGIGPSILFFLMAHYGFSRQLPLGLVLILSFGVWAAGAAVHQWLLR